MLRHTLLGLGLGLALACTGCGEDVADAEGRPYRERIDPEREADVAKRRLEPREDPFEIGETAPAFDALPGTGPAIVVFYRGHW